MYIYIIKRIHILQHLCVYETLTRHLFIINKLRHADHL